jgi:hypothetical protein
MPAPPTQQLPLTFQRAREADLLRACQQYLAACRLEHWRSNVVALAAEDHAGRRRYIHSLPKGFADLSLILPGGRAAFVECKAPRGTLTDHQQRWQERMRARGALVLTVRSIDELRQGLRAAGVAAP